MARVMMALWQQRRVTCCRREFKALTVCKFPNCFYVFSFLHGHPFVLQLAAAASVCSVGVTTPSTSGRPRGSLAARSRDVKPYQRPGTKGRVGRGAEVISSRCFAGDKDCWLPGGFWWKDDRAPIPPGRQPGELAGWTPLAGERAQQLLQEQKMVLSRQEQLVQVSCTVDHCS